jgi:hypothetical protein
MGSSTAPRGGKAAIPALQCPFLFGIFPEGEALETYAYVKAVDSRDRDPIEDKISDMLRGEL